MSERPNLLVSATIADAIDIKREFLEFTNWHIMTPRNRTEHQWLYGDYVWTPEAQKLPAQVRWDLRQRLIHVIDEDSNEIDFPTRVLNW